MSDKDLVRIKCYRTTYLVPKSNLIAYFRDAPFSKPCDKFYSRFILSDGTLGGAMGMFDMSDDESNHNKKVYESLIFDDKMKSLLEEE